MKKCIVIVFVLYSYTVVSQYNKTKYVDSLSLHLKSKNDSIKADALLSLAEYYMDFDQTRAEKYFNDALSIGKNLKFENKYFYVVYTDLGTMYANLQDYSKSNQYYKMAEDYAFDISEKVTLQNNIISNYFDLYEMDKSAKAIKKLRTLSILNGKLGMLNYYSNQANQNSRIGFFNKSKLLLDSGIALIKIHKPLDKYEKDLVLNFYQTYVSINAIMGNNNLETIAIYKQYLKQAEQDGRSQILKTAYISFAMLYYQQNRYFKALEWFKKEAFIGIKTRNNMLVAEGFLNVGGMFDLLNKYDSAAFYCQLSKKYALKSKDSIYILAADLGYVSAIYHLGKKEEAAELLKRITKACLDFPNIDLQLAYYTLLSNMQMDDENYINAKKNLSKVFEMNSEIKRPEIWMQYYNQMSKIFEFEKKEDSAFVYLKKYGFYKDSINEIVSLNSLDMAEAEYHNVNLKSENNELKIFNLSVTKKMGFWIFGLSALLIVFFTGIILQKKRNVKLKKQKITAQKAAYIELVKDHTLSNILNQSLSHRILGNMEMASDVISGASKFIRDSLQARVFDTYKLVNEIDLCNSYFKNIAKYQGVKSEINFINIDKPELINFPPHLILSCIENSFKHGLQNILNPSIKIEISQINTTLKIIVHDNGTGIDPNSEIIEGHGFGAKAIKKALLILKEETGKMGSSNVENIFNEQQQIIGCKVQVILPIS